MISDNVHQYQAYEFTTAEGSEYVYFAKDSLNFIFIILKIFKSMKISSRK